MQGTRTGETRMHSPGSRPRRPPTVPSRSCAREIAPTRARSATHPAPVRRTWCTRARQGKAHRTKSPAARRALKSLTTWSSTFGHLPMAGGRTVQIFVAAARACRRRSRNFGAWLHHLFTFSYIFSCARPRIRVAQPSHQSGTAQHTDQLH